jgi:putative tricarboxylic transport membrane protein
VEPTARSRATIRSPSDLLAGASLVAVAAFSLWAGRGLDSGTLRMMGPGMVPRAVAVAVGGVGLLLVLMSLLKDGPSLGRWPLRGPIVITLSVVAFALTIRTVGLAVAGPLVVIVGGAASPESRPRELVIFGLVMTALCIGLFRYLLSLPIPVLILPGVITL